MFWLLNKFYSRQHYLNLYKKYLEILSRDMDVKSRTKLCHKVERLGTLEEILCWLFKKRYYNIKGK